MATKTCNTCKDTKPITEFHVNRRRGDGHENKCKSCIRQARMARYWSDPEAARARSRANQKNFRKNRPQYWKWYADRMPGGRTEYFRRINRRRNYGLDHDSFETLLAEQGGVCAICKQCPEEDKLNRQWSVDHDHDTGKVRGILCRSCNWALGKFRDDLQLLRNAMAYLDQHH